MLSLACFLFNDISTKLICVPNRDERIVQMCFLYNQKNSAKGTCVIDNLNNGKDMIMCDEESRRYLQC